jgi:hypothetical protein
MFGRYLFLIRFGREGARAVHLVFSVLASALRFLGF